MYNGNYGIIMGFLTSFDGLSFGYKNGVSATPQFSFVNFDSYAFKPSLDFLSLFNFYNTNNTSYKSFGYNKSSIPLFSYSSFEKRTSNSFAPPTLGPLTTSGRSSVSSLSFSDAGSVKGDAFFEDSLAFVLSKEGGYANVPGDSGGATNKGITQATYNAWLKKNGLPAKNVRNITDNEVRQIYYNEFWKPLGCDKLPAKVALFIFDTGVNMGPGKAKEYLRRYNNGENLENLVSARESRYKEIAAASPEKKKFLNGWMNRMSSLKSNMALA